VPALVLPQTEMATILSPVDSREVVRCDCGLVQFIPHAGMSSPCRRCHVALDYQEPAPPPAAEPVAVSACAYSNLSAQLAANLRAARLRLGLSQRELAGRMNLPRTYVSKTENLKATPTLRTFERLARALETDIPTLLRGGERSRQQEVEELMKDQFIAELQPFVARLSEFQLRAILASVHRLTLQRSA
jgi:transcriptional regulator with XRE-family HTH domain